MEVTQMSEVFLSLRETVAWVMIALMLVAVALIVVSSYQETKQQVAREHKEDAREEERQRRIREELMLPDVNLAEATERMYGRKVQGSRQGQGG
jgi:hypothetical protein